MIEVTAPDLTVLDNEAGGHRIQRIPPTERKGRVHTSTVTVAVMNELIQHQVQFNEKDFKIEWYSGTGSGGQHRNKHQNSCRITHLESGIISTAQCRSRENSLNEAKAAILARLEQQQHRSQYLSHSQIRKNQVGSGERGDKIRTYYVQRDLVVDHVLGTSMSYHLFMKGYGGELYQTISSPSKIR